MDTLDEMVEVVKGFVGDSGTCSNERAVKAINQARRLLWNKREWNTVHEYFSICCVDGCFTLPNRYEQIRLAWMGNESVSLADEWFNATNAYALQADRSCHRLITEVGGSHVVFNDYNIRPYQIGIMVELDEDAGVELSFDVQDEYGSYSKIKLTTSTRGELVKTSKEYRAIRTATKPVTKGRIRVYAYDTQLELKTLISLYHPTDVNPTFRRFRTPKKCDSITLYASKRYTDLVDPLDLVEFSADAMIYAVMALNSRENRKVTDYMNNLAVAVQEAEKDMENDEIPTAAPLRIADYERPDNLIGSELLSPSATDYFMWR